MKVADLVTFLLYINNFTDPIKKLINFTEQFQNGYSGYERFLEIMDVEPDITDAKDAQHITSVKGDICFDNVSFKYEEKQDTVPVSYTHLDVYKRQVLEGTERKGRGADGAGKRSAGRSGGR